MTLATQLKNFIVNYIMTDKHQNSAGYEDRLEDAIDLLYSLCTTDAEREIVKAIISLEDH